MKVQVYPSWLIQLSDAEEFLASNRVRYEHHDVASDEAARISEEPRYSIACDNYRWRRGHHRLSPSSYSVLKLDVQVDLSGKTRWLMEKYGTMLGQRFRPSDSSPMSSCNSICLGVRWTLRDLMMPLSFP
jgi:hypothetical protein